MPYITHIMELANLLFIQAKKPGSYLFGLGSKEVMGVFLADGRFYIRRCIHLNGPLHWSPFKFMWMDKTQRFKRVILTWTSHMNNLKYKPFWNSFCAWLVTKVWSGKPMRSIWTCFNYISSFYFYVQLGTIWLLVNQDSGSDVNNWTI